MYKITFYHVSKSGKQKNMSLFEDKDLALSFAIQLNMDSNIEDVFCEIVEVKTISVIDLCESIHGKEGKYEIF